MSNGSNNDDVASLTEKAYQAISTAIANLQFKPGEALKQDHLARWLSISRTPVREAIQDVRRRLHRITINSATRPERLLACTHEHMKVADAIVRGDADAAAELMRAHIDAMSASALSLIRTYIVPVRGER